MSNARFPGIVKLLPYPPKWGAEIGVNRGETAEALLREFPGLDLLMVDLWRQPPRDSRYRRTGDPCASKSQAKQDEAYEEALRRVAFAGGRAHAIRMDFREIAKAVRDADLDFVFLDADHSYQGTREAIEIWAPRVKPGGLVCGHDYDAPWAHCKGVKRAVDEAAERWGVKLLRADPYIWGWIQP